jgi:hypothetical protein
MAPLKNVAPAPLPGDKKVTLAPLAGLPAESRTVTTSGFGKEVPATVDWGVPLVATTLAIVVLVSANEAVSP